MSEKPRGRDQLNDDDERDETQSALDAVERAIGGHLSSVDNFDDHEAQNQPDNQDS